MFTATQIISNILSFIEYSGEYTLKHGKVVDILNVLTNFGSRGSLKISVFQSVCQFISNIRTK
jgi:hypothetical protein